MSKLIKPGTDEQKTGKYIDKSSRGGNIKKTLKTTIGKSDRLPPTQKAGRKGEKK